MNLNPVLVMKKKAKTAWDRLYAALYIGGAIEKPSPTINTELLRNIRADFPALSLLGSALYTVTLSGVIMKGFAIPFCAETVNAKFWHSPHPVEYIPPFAELLTDMSFSRHIDTDLNSKNSGVKPMLYEIETINVGTYFEFNIDFSVIAKPIEKSAAAHIINNLTHLGGKISSGFGKISIISKLNDSGEYEEYLSQIKDNPYEFRKKLIELAKTLG